MASGTSLSSSFRDSAHTAVWTFTGPLTSLSTRGSPISLSWLTVAGGSHITSAGLEDRRPASTLTATVYSLVRNIGAWLTTSALWLTNRQQQKTISVEQLAQWLKAGVEFPDKDNSKVVSTSPPATDNVMAVNILFIFLNCPRGSALSPPCGAASQAPALFHPSLSFWLTAGTVHLHRSAVGFFQHPRLSPPESLKIDYSGDRITLVQFLQECLRPFVMEDLDQKWSI